MSPRSRNHIEPRNIALLIAVLLFVAYVPSLGGEFLWDDFDNFSQSEAVRAPDGIFRIWTDPHSTQQYYPLTHSSFWLQYQLSGDSPGPLRFINLALHALSSWLVFRVLSQLKLKGALVAAALFALHPLHVESVAWITERKNTLSLPLYLGASYFFFRYQGIAAKSRKTTQKPRRDYSLALLLYLLGLAAKTSLSVLPAIWLVCLYWKKPNLKWRDAFLLAPFFFFGLCASAITAWIEVVDIGAQGEFFSFSPLEKVLRAASIFWFYLIKLALPFEQSFVYPKWDIGVGEARLWFAALALLLTCSLCLWKARTGRGKGPLAATVCYGIAIFPALGLFNVLFMQWAFVQDHFCYGASIPPLALLAEAGVRYAPRRRPVGPIVFAAVCLTLTGLTAIHSYRFASYDRLFQHALIHAPKSWLLNHNLALRYHLAGQKHLAETHYRVALQEHPGLGVAHNNLGSLLMERGAIEEALRHMAAGAQDKSHLAPTYQRNYALALLEAHHHREAAVQLALQIKRQPTWVKGYRLLAWLLATSPEPEVRDGKRAVDLATYACERTKTTLARCLLTLAASQAETGAFDKARKLARQARDLAQSEGQRDSVVLATHMEELFSRQLPYRHHTEKGQRERAALP